MNSAGVLDSLASLERAAHEFLQVVNSGGLASLPAEEFIDVAQELEALRRQLETADYAVAAEVGVRELPDGPWLTRNAAGFLGAIWRISPKEANARVREAAALAPRSELSGEKLEPLRAVTAKARDLGILSREQVELIDRTLGRLPAAMPVADVEEYERILVEAAHALNAKELKAVATRILETIDPDGPEPSEEDQQRKRFVSLTREFDGMTRVTGLLDPETAAKAQTVLDARSAPRPDDAGGRDERTAGQRMHDAFGEILDVGLRAGEFATPSGAPVQLVITMTLEQFESRSGHAKVSTGGRIRIDSALLLADEACIAWAVQDAKGAVLDLGRTQRLASRAQILALIARDGGCIFPGCTAPPEWTERHHILEWLFGGKTDLCNLVLLCKYHHRRHLKAGWRIVMVDGIPWWIPPKEIDPQQTPIRNRR